MEDVHFRRIKSDDFQAVEPDSLMTSVSQSNLGRTLLISLGGHLVVVLLLSLGNIGLCVKYRTVNLRSAFEQRDVAAKEAIIQQRAAEADARRKELEAKAAVAPVEAAPVTKPGAGVPGTPKVIQETREVSNERPESSSLDSIDSLLE